MGVDMVMVDMDMEDMDMEDMDMEDMVTMEGMAKVTEDMVIVLEVMAVLDMEAIAKTMATVIHKGIHNLQPITKNILSNQHTKSSLKHILNLKPSKLHRRTPQLKHTKAHILKILTMFQHIPKIVTVMPRLIIRLTNNLAMWLLQTMVKLQLMAINSNTRVQPILSKLFNINKLFKILLQLQM